MVNSFIVLQNALIQFIFSDNYANLLGWLFLLIILIILERFNFKHTLNKIVFNKKFKSYLKL